MREWTGLSHPVWEEPQDQSNGSYAYSMLIKLPSYNNGWKSLSQNYDKLFLFCWSLLYWSSLQVAIVKRSLYSSKQAKWPDMHDKWNVAVSILFEISSPLLVDHLNFYNKTVAIAKLLTKRLKSDYPD